MVVLSLSLSLCNFVAIGCHGNCSASAILYVVVGGVGGVCLMILTLIMIIIAILLMRKR